jgi:hypothetical protein
MDIFRAIVILVRSFFQSRFALAGENLALL